MRKVLYKVTYSNGVTQICNLISRYEYETTIKVYKEQIIDFTNQMSKLSKNSKKYQELNQKCKELNMKISEYGDFFVDDSPLGKALWSASGYMELPLHQGGKHKVLFERIN